ncbi:MAG: M16 family metallopeptidase [Planctomycetota bacterium]|jgi:predicted Zn-dependent peptidase
MRVVRLLHLFAFVLFASPLSAGTKAEDVKTFTLKNGMKFIVLEDHSIPNANMYLFWRVGSRNEVPGITGLSHFFEHMMFNGAKKYGPKAFDRVMEAHGGSNNAYTSENVTVFTNWFPASAMETIFDLEGDRVGHLAFDDAMIESERGVVISERITSRENSPWALLQEHVKASAFMAHPYRWPVLGYESDIRNWRKADLQKYFKTYYAPNNCVVVMVGDLMLETVQRLAERTFGPLPRGPEPRPIHTREPEQRGERRVRVEKNIPAPTLLIAFHAPESKAEDYLATEVLASILGEGRSSRLYRTLVDEKQLAVEVDVYFPHSIDPNLLYIYAVCNEGVGPGDLERGITGVLDALASEGVTERERQKVVNRKIVDFYREMETINGKADLLGTHEVFFGGWKRLFGVPTRYGKVTSEAVQQAAKRILKPSNRTVGLLASPEVK